MLPLRDLDYFLLNRMLNYRFGDALAYGLPDSLFDRFDGLLPTIFLGHCRFLHVSFYKLKQSRAI